MTSFTVDASQALSAIDKVKGAIQSDLKQVLGKALTDAKFEIDKRTRSGKTVEGGSFEKYAASTKAYRSKKGRNTSTVDLTFTGAMLRNMQVRITQTGRSIVGEIYFTSAAEAAKASRLHFGDRSSNLPARPFFDLSKKQLAEVKRKVEEAINGRG